MPVRVRCTCRVQVRGAPDGAAARRGPVPPLPAARRRARAAARPGGRGAGPARPAGPAAPAALRARRRRHAAARARQPAVPHGRAHHHVNYISSRSPLTSVTQFCL